MSRDRVKCFPVADQDIETEPMLADRTCRCGRNGTSPRRGLATVWGLQDRSPVWTRRGNRQDDECPVDKVEQLRNGEPSPTLEPLKQVATGGAVMLIAALALSA